MGAGSVTTTLKTQEEAGGSRGIAVRTPSGRRLWVPHTSLIIGHFRPARVRSNDYVDTLSLWNLQA